MSVLPAAGLPDIAQYAKVSPAMRVDDVLERLQPCTQSLAELGVRSLFVFGSVARGEAGEASNVDFLVEFDGPTTFRRFMNLKLLLEDALERPVDLATRKMLRERTRSAILGESIQVA